MAIYTVHVPDDASDLVTQADRTVFIREGFSSWAFLLGVVYLLWHRLWLAAAIWIVLVAAAAAVGFLFHPPAFFMVALASLMHWYLGLEAHDLRRWSLGRRGYRMAELVSAGDMTEAELRVFGRQPAPHMAPRSVHRRSAVPAAPAVIGMFPDETGA